jgi:hypothetical protein
MYLSLRAFIADARHNHLLLVPAAFYAINNYLKARGAGWAGGLARIARHVERRKFRVSDGCR